MIYATNTRGQSGYGHLPHKSRLAITPLDHKHARAALSPPSVACLPPPLALIDPYLGITISEGRARARASERAGGRAVIIGKKVRKG